MKTNRTNEKKVAFNLAISLIGALAIFVAIALAFKSTPPPIPLPAGQPVQSSAPVIKVPGYAEVVRPLNDLYLNKLHGQKIDKFWLQGNEDMHAWVKVTQAWKAKVIGLMRKFKAVNPMTAKVMAAFPDFTLTEFVNDRSVHHYLGKTTDEEIAARLSLLEVCVVSQKQRSAHDFPSNIYYNVDWKSLMVVAIDIPDSFLIAMLYHEFGHAHKHRIEQAPSATARERNDLWISEEVEMHDVEHQVLNHSSNGQLNQLYDRIMARTQSNTPIELMRSIKAEDFVAYDQMFGLTEAGPIMASVYLGQFYLGLSFHAIDRQVPDNLRLKAKIEFYRWFINNN